MSRTPFDLVYEILVSNLSPATGLIFLNNTFGSLTRELVDQVEGSMYAVSDYAGRRPMYFEGEDIPVVLKKVNEVSVAEYDGTIFSFLNPNLAKSSALCQGPYVSQPGDNASPELPWIISRHESAPSGVEGHTSITTPSLESTIEIASGTVNTNGAIMRKCQWGACNTVLELKGSQKEKEHMCKEHINTHHYVYCQWRGCTCKKSVNNRCGERGNGHPAHMVDISAHLIRHYEVDLLT